MTRVWSWHGTCSTGRKTCLCPKTFSKVAIFSITFQNFHRQRLMTLVLSPHFLLWAKKTQIADGRHTSHFSWQCVRVSVCVTVALHHHLHILSYDCLATCLPDNPHSLPVNKCVGVTLPVRFFTRPVGRLPRYWCVFRSLWLTVGVKHLPPDFEADACGFSVSYCQLGRSHAQISRYLNEHPTLMPLSVSAPV